jgi:hypothetical protein
MVPPNAKVFVRSGVFEHTCHDRIDDAVCREQESVADADFHADGQGVLSSVKWV